MRDLQDVTYHFFAGVLGAIDSTHIKCCPSIDEQQSAKYLVTLQMRELLPWLIGTKKSTLFSHFTVWMILLKAWMDEC